MICKNDQVEVVFNLKGKEHQRKEEKREIFHYWITSQMATIASASQDKAWSQELHFGLPNGWQDPKYLGHHPLSSQPH